MRKIKIKTKRRSDPRTRAHRKAHSDSVFLAFPIKPGNFPGLLSHGHIGLHCVAWSPTNKMGSQTILNMLSRKFWMFSLSWTEHFPWQCVHVLVLVWVCSPSIGENIWFFHKIHHHIFRRWEINWKIYCFWNCIFECKLIVSKKCWITDSFLRMQLEHSTDHSIHKASNNNLFSMKSESTPTSPLTVDFAWTPVCSFTFNLPGLEDVSCLT